MAVFPDNIIRNNNHMLHNHYMRKKQFQVVLHFHSPHMKVYVHIILMFLDNQSRNSNTNQIIDLLPLTASNYSRTAACFEKFLTYLINS